MSIYDDVRDWHGLIPGLVPFGEAPDWSPEFVRRRLNLIHEEIVSELMPAIATGNRTEILDGICDGVWVLLGTAVELGMDFDAAWEEVRRSNFTKVGGTLNEYGKLQKPAHYEAPRTEVMEKAASSNKRETP